MADALPRHPSQLYEALYSLAIAIILYLLWQRKVQSGITSFAFLALYGISRITVEILWREPLDGFVLGLPAGAAWSLPILLAGSAGLLFLAKKQS